MSTITAGVAQFGRDLNPGTHRSGTPGIRPSMTPSRYEEGPLNSAVTEGAQRVLVISADMGGGHNATAAALEEAVLARWPGSELHRLDALDVMGPGVGPLFRKTYVSNVETTPWLYEFFYSSLWRHRWFARSSKRFVGAWCGRRLAGHIDRFDPSLVLSTYPLGSAGLAWLRTHRGLEVPTGAWISDFAPHPFWVYRELDCNFVVDPCAIAVALAAEPEAHVALSPLPVLQKFHGGNPAQARAQLGLTPQRLVVLLSCGSYAFGDTDAMVATACDSHADVTVLAVCGRDEGARRRLEQLGLPPDKLITFGWTDQMPTLIRAADLVLSNAGGATVLEALAAGTPVVSVAPIAAHGAANANLLTVAGLCDVCLDLGRLDALLGSAASDRAALLSLRERIHTRAITKPLESTFDQLRHAAADREVPSRPWPMRASDAFFAHLDDTHTPQEVGVVLDIGPRPDGTRLHADALAERLQSRVAGLPPTRRVLSRRPLGWRLVDEIDVREHLEEMHLPADSPPAALWQLAGDLWAKPLAEGRPGWKMRLVHDADRQRTLLAVKLHHCHGDGISALGLLDRLLDTATGDPLRERRPLRRRSRARLRPVRLAHGLLSLASRGNAPRHRLNQRAVRGRPALVSVALPWADVRTVAKAHNAHPYELMVGMVAEALCTLLGDTRKLHPGSPLRAMVPVALRPPRLDRVFGNWTGSIAIDLPTGPMPPATRVALIQQDIRRRTARGEPQAAAAVMWLAGHLPHSAHRWCARKVYGWRFFNTVISYMPTARGPRWVVDAQVRTMTPVLPLANRVPLTVGVIVADGVAGVGVLADEVLGLSHQSIHDAVVQAFVALGGQMPHTEIGNR